MAGINLGFDSGHFLVFYIRLWFTQKQNTRTSRGPGIPGIPIAGQLTAALNMV